MKGVKRGKETKNEIHTPLKHERNLITPIWKPRKPYTGEDKKTEME